MLVVVPQGPDDQTSATKNITADPDETATKTSAPHGARKARSEPKSRAALNAGDMLGRFTIVELLGEGGMGAVYRATDDELGRQVAIKVLSVTEVGDSAAGGSLESRLMREAQALAKVSHPNVIAIYDVARDRGVAFVAMELVEGLSLKRWLKVEQRGRAEILEVLTQAGRGLAAAHAVGLVHRDFKPDNVIVGTDGRVRVLDFGLARAAGPTIARANDPDLRVQEDTPPPLDDLHSGIGSSDLLASPLTRVGLVVGTPPFMAPEQHMGAEVDARSDQFSFCVALYRALYGELPFAGERQAELKTNVLAGRVREPSPNKDVPQWLRNVLLRGLSVQPDARFPTMDALLAALADDPAVTRAKRLRVTAMAATFVGLALVTGWALWRGQAAAIDPCGGAASELAGVWNADKRATVDKAFAQSGRSYAGETFAHVVERIDRYTSRWVTMRGEACRATKVAGRQSPLVLDLRVRCLDRRRAAVGALVDLFGEKPDGELVDHALDAVEALPRIESCADIDALTATTPLPDDPAMRKRIEASAAQVDRVDALFRAGKSKQAEPIAKSTLEEARTLRHPPLLARALVSVARIKNALDQFKDAVPLLDEALHTASKAHDDATVVSAWQTFVDVRVRAGEYDAAVGLRLPAELALARGGDDPAMRGELNISLSTALYYLSRLDEAEVLLGQTLADAEKLFGPESTQVAQAADVLGNVRLDKGDLPGARHCSSVRSGSARRSTGHAIRPPQPS